MEHNILNKYNKMLKLPIKTGLIYTSKKIVEYIKIVVRHCNNC